MVVVIVKWYIKDGKEESFIEKWKEMDPKSYGSPKF
jgi:heme-degrading monooxygenase HmoA